MENNKDSYLQLAVLALIWGSSFILMKEGLKFYSSYQVAAFRIALAGLFLLPFIRWRKVVIQKGDLKYFALSGILGNGIPAFLFTAAQTQISSSLTGALNSLTPLFALTVGILFMGVKLNIYKVIGVIVGLAGALMLILNQGIIVEGMVKEGGNVAYTLWVVLAAVLYGINVNIIKQKLSHYPALLIASLPLGIISIGGLLILLFIGLPVDLSDAQSIKSLGAISILAIVGTALSLILFNRVIQKTNAVFASSVTYLIPIVAMLWGYVDDEVINFWQIMGLLLILVAIRTVNRK